MFLRKAAKSEEVIDYSYYFFENFQTSVVDFYNAVGQELVARKVPDLEVKRIVWSEGGLLSANREYLRLTRERLVFDICAAPFGTGFFFSCRFCEIRAVINPFAILLLSIIVFGGIAAFVQSFGTFWGPVVFLCAVGAGAWVLRNAVAVGLGNVDAALIKAPGIGPVYERFFRKETYYREDTRVMYLQTVPAIVKRLVEELTAARGVKLSERIEGKTFQSPKVGI